MLPPEAGGKRPSEPIAYDGTTKTCVQKRKELFGGQPIPTNAYLQLAALWRSREMMQVLADLGGFVVRRGDDEAERRIAELEGQLAAVRKAAGGPRAA